MYLIARHTTGLEGLRCISGALLLASVIQFGIGFTGLVGLVRRIFSPIVTGPVILVIGLSLFHVGAAKAGQNWIIAGLTISLVFIFAYGGERLLRGRLRLIFRTLPVLLTISIVSAISWGLLRIGVLGADTTSSNSIAVFRDVPWNEVALLPFHWLPPIFSLSFFVATLAATLAATVDSIGNFHACTQVCRLPNPSAEQLNKGVALLGLTSTLAALLGGLGNTVYSENLGLVQITRVASRRVMLWTGALVLLAGLWTKAGALLLAIPSSIMGGLYCILFGMIAGTGLQIIASAKPTPRDAAIMGFTTFMGLAVPFYIQQTPQLPEQLSFLAIGEMIVALGGTGVAVTAFLGILLDNLLPRRATLPEQSSAAIVLLPGPTRPPGAVNGAAPKDQGDKDLK